MIRFAKYADIPAAVELLADAHRRSNHADDSTFSPSMARAVLTQGLQRVGGKHDGSTMMFVAVNESGEIEGVMLGLIQRMYDVCEEMEATDQFFIVREGADPSSAGGLIDALFDWADSIEGVKEVRMGAIDAVTDFRRTALLYQRKNMVQSGVIYSRRAA
jgi:hypothetical protein